MHRFFADEDSRIRGDEYKHLTRVLRLSEGDEIEALTGGKRFRVRITAIDGESAAFERLEELPSHETACRVTLYQGLCKGEKMDFIVQKCTEIGAAAIVPVLMERCVVKPEGRQKDRPLCPHRAGGRQAVRKIRRAGGAARDAF